MNSKKNIFAFSLWAIMATGLSSIAFADQAGDASLAVKFGNVDFSNSQIAGVTAVQTSNWNLVASGASGSQTSFNEDIGGTASPVTLTAFSWSAPELIGSFATPFGDARSFQSPSNNAELMYGGLGSNGGTTTINLSGLGSEFSTNGFSLYVYTSDTDSNNRGGTITINGATSQDTLNTDPNSPPNAWVLTTDASTPGDYVLFTGLTGSSLSISMTATIDSEIEGFEIVANAAAVPEPSTYALLFGGVLVLGFVVRRGCNNDGLLKVS